MLDLEARIDFEEVERLLAALREHEILAGRHADVVRLAQQADRRLADLLDQSLRQARRRALFDHLLVLSLHGAVAQAERQHRSVTVGRHLHLDVPRARDHRLDEERAVAEGVGGLALRAVERGQRVVAVAEHADASTAAARGRLEHDRVADPARVAGELVSLDRSAAPRRDGNTRCLGDQLARDLVAEPSHRRGRRPQEDQPCGLELLDEARVLGQETPARPDRVRTSRAERGQHAVVIEVRGTHGAARARAERRPERERLVGLAHERRRGIGLRVERDPDELAALLHAQLAYRAERARRCFAAIQDRDSPDLATQRSCPLRRS